MPEFLPPPGADTLFEQIIRLLLESLTPGDPKFWGTILTVILILEDRKQFFSKIYRRLVRRERVVAAVKQRPVEEIDDDPTNYRLVLLSQEGVNARLSNLEESRKEMGEWRREFQLQMRHEFDRAANHTDSTAKTIRNEMGQMKEEILARIDKVFTTNDANPN